VENDINMNRNEILLHIEQILKTLDEQQQRLQSFTREIPALESDVMLRQIRQLYEYALQLEKAPTGITQEPIATVTETVAETLSPTPIEEKHESPTEHIMIEAIKTETSAEDVIPVAGIKPRKVKGDINSVLFKDEPTLGDRFEGSQSLHAKIASAPMASSVAAHLQHKPISDLKKAIGLNEKFLFINQLFDGNLQVYNQVIDHINICPNKEAAEEYIQNTLVQQFGWDIQNTSCRLFLEMVERRFLITK